MLQHSNHSVNAIRQSLENLLKSTYKSNLKIPKFIIDSQYKFPSLTVKFIKTPLKALFYLGFSAVPFRFTI